MQISTMQKPVSNPQTPVSPLVPTESASRKFARQLPWMLAVGVSFLLLDRAIGFFMEKNIRESKYRYSKLYFADPNAPKPDILLVGNSRGAGFYQPAIKEATNAESFNLSYNGLPANLADALVRDYIDRHQPKIMIVDPTLCDRRSPELIKDFRVYANQSPRLDSLLRHESKTMFYASKFFSTYRHNSEVFSRALIHRNGGDEETVPTNLITKERIEDTATQLYKISVDSTMVVRLSETVAYARAKGVDVRMVIMPYFKRFGENAKPYFLDSLKMRWAAVSDLPIKDYSTELDDNAAFADYQHLNKDGAKKFVQMMVQDGILSSQNLTPPVSAPVESQNSAPSLPETPPAEIPVPQLPVAPPANAPIPQTAPTDLIQTPIPDPRPVAKPRRKSRRSNEPFIAVDTLF